LAAMARSIEQRGHHVTCALIGTSQHTIIRAAKHFERRLSMSWCIQTEVSKRSE